MKKAVPRGLNLSGFDRFSQSDLRQLITEAVHRAVCEFTDSDGFGQCMHYASAGFVLASRVFKSTYYVPQAGSLYIVADPPDGVVAFDVSDDGMQRGEFHCWFAGRERLDPGTHEALEIADLSSRHYKRFANQAHISEVRKAGDATILLMDSSSNSLQWTRTDEPPQFVWTDEPPTDLMWVAPDETACKVFWDKLTTNHDYYSRLSSIAWRHLTELCASENVTVTQDASTATRDVRQDGFRGYEKIGRNSHCPCGSGRKFKKCCISHVRHLPARD